MSLPQWHSVPLAEIGAGDPGWRYDDAMLLEKLATSLRRHGQLRPVVTCRTPAGERVVVDGRKLLRAMRDLGWSEAMVVDLGTLDAHTARRVALDLELRFETDYAAVSQAVAGLLEQDVTAESLAQASPFTAERIGYFAKLATFDWSQFSGKPEGQTALDWGGLAETGPPAALEAAREADPELAVAEEPPPLAAAVEAPAAPAIQLPEPLDLPTPRGVPLAPVQPRDPGMLF